MCFAPVVKNVVQGPVAVVVGTYQPAKTEVNCAPLANTIVNDLNHRKQ